MTASGFPIKEFGNDRPERLKIIALATAFFFSASTILWSAPAVTIEQAPPQDLEVFVSSGAASLIPKGIGTLHDSFQIEAFTADSLPSNQPFIIHIQDAHANVNAQENIMKLIEFLSKRYRINLVALEGTDGPLDVTPYQAVGDRKILEELVNEFVEKRIFTGPEGFAILYQGGQGEMSFQGVEERGLYIRDLMLYRNALKEQDAALEALGRLEAAVNQWIGLTTQKRFQTFLTKKESFHTGLIDLVSYARFLNEEIDRMYLGVLLKRYPTLGRFLDHLRQEKIEPGFELRARAEETKFAKSLGPEKEKSYWILKRKAAEGEVDLSNLVQFVETEWKGRSQTILKYPYFRRYIQNFAFLASAPSSELFSELGRLEDDLAQAMMILKSELHLWEIKERLRIARNLFELELVPEDYEKIAVQASDGSAGLNLRYMNQILPTWGEFDFHLVIARLERLAEQYDIPKSEIPSYLLSEKLNQWFKSFFDFYEVARKRDQALVANTLEMMKREGRTRAFLITGGFHAKGIASLLREKEVAYLSVAPRISEFGAEDEKIYKSLISGEIPALNEFFARETINSSPITSGNGHYLSGDGTITFGDAKEVVPGVSRGNFRTSQQERVYKVFYDRYSELTGIAQKSALVSVVDASPQGRRSEIRTSKIGQAESNLVLISRRAFGAGGLAAVISLIEACIPYPDGGSNITRNPVPEATSTVPDYSGSRSPPEITPTAQLGDESPIQGLITTSVSNVPVPPNETGVRSPQMERIAASLFQVTRELGENASLSVSVVFRPEVGGDGLILNPDGRVVIPLAFNTKRVNAIIHRQAAPDAESLVSDESFTIVVDSHLLNPLDLTAKFQRLADSAFSYLNDPLERLNRYLSLTEKIEFQMFAGDLLFGETEGRFTIAGDGLRLTARPAIFAERALTPEQLRAQKVSTMTIPGRAAPFSPFAIPGARFQPLIGIPGSIRYQADLTDALGGVDPGTEIGLVITLNPDKAVLPESGGRFPILVGADLTEGAEALLSFEDRTSGTIGDPQPLSFGDEPLGPDRLAEFNVTEMVARSIGENDLPQAGSLPKLVVKIRVGDIPERDGKRILNLAIASAGIRFGAHEMFPGRVINHTSELPDLSNVPNLITRVEVPETPENPFTVTPNDTNGSLSIKGALQPGRFMAFSLDRIVRETETGDPTFIDLEDLVAAPAFSALNAAFVEAAVADITNQTQRVVTVPLLEEGRSRILTSEEFFAKLREAGIDLSDVTADPSRGAYLTIRIPEAAVIRPGEPTELTYFPMGVPTKVAEELPPLPLEGIYDPTDPDHRKSLPDWSSGPNVSVGKGGIDDVVFEVDPETGIVSAASFLQEGQTAEISFVPRSPLLNGGRINAAFGRLEGDSVVATPNVFTVAADNARQIELAWDSGLGRKTRVIPIGPEHQNGAFGFISRANFIPPEFENELKNARYVSFILHFRNLVDPSRPGTLYVHSNGAPQVPRTPTAIQPRSEVRSRLLIRRRSFLRSVAGVTATAVGYSGPLALLHCLKGCAPGLPGSVPGIYVDLTGVGKLGNQTHYVLDGNTVLQILTEIDGSRIKEAQYREVLERFNKIELKIEGALVPRNAEGIPIRTLRPRDGRGTPAELPSGFVSFFPAEGTTENSSDSVSHRTFYYLTKSGQPGRSVIYQTPEGIWLDLFQSPVTIPATWFGGAPAYIRIILSRPDRVEIPITAKTPHADSNLNLLPEHLQRGSVLFEFGGEHEYPPQNLTVEVVQNLGPVTADQALAALLNLYPERAALFSGLPRAQFFSDRQGQGILPGSGAVSLGDRVDQIVSGAVRINAQLTKDDSFALIHLGAPRRAGDLPQGFPEAGESVPDEDIIFGLRVPAGINENRIKLIPRNEAAPNPAELEFIDDSGNVIYGPGSWLILRIPVRGIFYAFSELSLEVLRSDLTHGADPNQPVELEAIFPGLDTKQQVLDGTLNLVPSAGARSEARQRNDAGEAAEARRGEEDGSLKTHRSELRLNDSWLTYAAVLLAAGPLVAAMGWLILERFRDSRNSERKQSDGRSELRSSVRGTPGELPEGTKRKPVTLNDDEAHEFRGVRGRALPREMIVPKREGTILKPARKEESSEEKGRAELRHTPTRLTLNALARRAEARIAPIREQAQSALDEADTAVFERERAELRIINAQSEKAGGPEFAVTPPVQQTIILLNKGALPALFGFLRRLVEGADEGLKQFGEFLGSGNLAQAGVIEIAVPGKPTDVSGGTITVDVDRFLKYGQDQIANSRWPPTVGGAGTQDALREITALFNELPREMRGTVISSLKLTDNRFGRVVLLGSQLTEARAQAIVYSLALSKELGSGQIFYRVIDDTVEGSAQADRLAVMHELAQKIGAGARFQFIPRNQNLGRTLGAVNRADILMARQFGITQITELNALTVFVVDEFESSDSIFIHQLRASYGDLYTLGNASKFSQVPDKSDNETLSREVPDVQSAGSFQWTQNGSRFVEGLERILAEHFGRLKALISA